MKISGTAAVAAPVARVWDALQDPAVLVRTIPGCERLEAVGPDTYKMTVTAGIAAVRGTYVGQVALSDPEPPRSFTLRARGQGAPGTVDATVAVRLAADGAGGTTVEYDADATVGGMIGGVGQRMLGTAARRTAGEFFAAVERALTEPAAPAVQPAVAADAEPAAAAGAVYTAPAGIRRVRGGSAPAWPMTAAFAAGATVALAGVALGYALGRRRSATRD